MPVIWSSGLALLDELRPNRNSGCIDANRGDGGIYLNDDLLIIFGVFLGGLTRFKPDIKLVAWGMGYKFLICSRFCMGFDTYALLDPLC